VVASLLRTLAFAMSALVVLGFAMFAVDQSSAASKRQEAKVTDIDAVAPAAAPAAERAHTGVRGTIDGIDRTLLAPFGTVGGDSEWLKHGVPALLAFLLYGVGLGYLARWIELRL
jgi:hypothetical protein